MPAELLIQRDGPIATMVLNRPERHNALKLAMYEAMPDLLGTLDADPAVKILVLRGAGEEAFASGADITEFQQLRSSAEAAQGYNEQAATAERSLALMSKPTIAMIHGYCIGGGAGLALSCDMRFADERASFAIPPAKLGIVYGLESTKRLIDLVGPARAKWILMSANPIEARRAAGFGLFDELATTADLPQATYAFARTICGRAQGSVRAAKQIVHRILGGQTEDDDATRELRNASYGTDDYAEGVRAFLENRTPHFSPDGYGTGSSLRGGQA